MNKIRDDWINTTDYMIKRAASAASQINSKLAAIKDQDVYVYVHKVNVAQHGFHGTVTEPTMFLAGEAGQERVDISPSRSAPHVTRAEGGGGGGGEKGQIVVNLTNVLADREIIRTYRRKLGEDMYRFGPA
jgi:hypothetical protein